VLDINNIKIGDKVWYQFRCNTKLGTVKRIRPKMGVIVVVCGDYIHHVTEAYESELDLLITKVENAKEELERYRAKNIEINND